MIHSSHDKTQHNITKGANTTNQANLLPKSRLNIGLIAPWSRGAIFSLIGIGARYYQRASRIMKISLRNNNNHHHHYLGWFINSFINSFIHYLYKWMNESSEWHEWKGAAKWWIYLCHKTGDHRRPSQAQIIQLLGGRRAEIRMNDDDDDSMEITARNLRFINSPTATTNYISEREQGVYWTWSGRQTNDSRSKVTQTCGIMAWRACNLSKFCSNWSRDFPFERLESGRAPRSNDSVRGGRPIE